MCIRRNDLRWGTGVNNWINDNFKTIADSLKQIARKSTTTTLSNILIIRTGLDSYPCTLPFPYSIVDKRILLFYSVTAATDSDKRTLLKRRHLEPDGHFRISDVVRIRIYSDTGIARIKMQSEKFTTFNKRPRFHAAPDQCDVTNHLH